MPMTSASWRGDDVGGARTGRDQDNTGLARSASVALGHMSSTLFVLREDKIEMLRIVYRVVDGENGSARVADCGESL